MDNKKYNTRQRNELLEFFKNNSDKCFLAKDIIKSASLSVGEATIYRTLSKFVDEGVLKKFVAPGSEGAYYQYNKCSHDCSSHFHLKCVNCGTLFHVDCSFLSEIDSHIMEHHRFAIDNSKTVFYGVCESCGGECQ